MTADNPVAAAAARLRYAQSEVLKKKNHGAALALQRAQQDFEGLKREHIRMVRCLVNVGGIDIPRQDAVEVGLVEVPEGAE